MTPEELLQPGHFPPEEFDKHIDRLKLGSHADRLMAMRLVLKRELHNHEPAEQAEAETETSKLLKVCHTVGAYHYTTIQQLIEDLPPSLRTQAKLGYTARCFSKRAGHLQLTTKGKQLIWRHSR